MTAFMMPTSLQDIEESLEIGIGIGMGMIDRMAHAGLRRKMDHHRKPMFGKQPIHRRTIRQIEVSKTETGIVTQDIQS